MANIIRFLKLLFRACVEKKSLCSASLLVRLLEFGVSFGLAFTGSCWAWKGMLCKLSTVYEDTFDLPIEQGYSDILNTASALNSLFFLLFITLGANFE
jgi:hypothetical protein